MKLSHSSKETFLTCSEKWRLHYQERLRSVKIGSALILGSALDDAFNRLLLEKKKIHTDAEKMLLNLDATETFFSKFKHVYINGEYIDVRRYIHADYYKSDIDFDLLGDDLDIIFTEANELGLAIKTSDELKQFLSEYSNILKSKMEPEDNEKLLYNFIAWNSLKNKGLLILKTYAKEIIPQIEEVFSIQEEVSLPDGESSELIGYIDFVASFVDEPGVKYVVDNKTSSKPYKNDAVGESHQLATYCEFKNIKKAAFIVAEKSIRKREPKVRINIIKGEVTDQLLDETFDVLTKVFHDIKDNKFEKNMESCYAYGKPCPYYNYCRTKQLKGLVYLEK